RACKRRFLLIVNNLDYKSAIIYISPPCSPKIVDNMSLIAEVKPDTELPDAAAETVQTRSDIVFQTLQADITRGKIKPGTKISEAGLASEYGISRGPLREALNRLESRGLIERIPHVGARVVSLNLKEL